MNRRLSFVVAFLLAATVATAALANARPSAPTAAIGTPTMLGAVGDAATVSVKQTSTSTPFDFTASDISLGDSAVVSNTSGGGLSVTKARFSPLKLTKPYDASSLELHKLMFAGKSALRVTIKLTDGGGYVIGNAFVTSIQSSAPGSEALPTDRVTFHFIKLRLTTPDGASTCWSVSTGTATCP